MPHNIETIYAPATAPGRAGVCILRISGPDAKTAIAQLTQKKLEPRKASLCLLRDPVTHEAIDRVLLLYFPAPHSFTGEDIIEIHAHGSRAVLNRLLDLYSTFDNLRLAQAGEFARRAFENGKMDLTAIEGLADLVNAQSEGQRKQALRQSEGELGKLYETWRSDLLQASALMAALLDFSDEEDVGDNLYDQARMIISALASKLENHLADARRGQRLRDGFQIVIAGAPNVGKSSLLNLLARRDAAIISSEPGTTRDIIEVQLELAGMPVLVMDTAGIRQTDGAIEREGIRRTISRMRDADLVLWLQDSLPDNQGAKADLDKDDMVLTDLRSETGSPHVWSLLSKLDLHHVPRETLPQNFDLAISTKSGHGIDELMQRLETWLAEDEMAQVDPLLTRARHRQEVQTALDSLQLFLQSSGEDAELRAEDLRRASDALGRLTGRIDVEELLGTIFGEFCIGK